MKFEEQIENAELIINIKPRVFIKWNNTEVGRDKVDCYERIEVEGTKEIFYRNSYGKNNLISSNHLFFEKLEKIYQDLMISKRLENWKPDDWKGTLEEWKEIVGLEYVLSQGYQEEGDTEKYKKLHLKGWFGIEPMTQEKANKIFDSDLGQQLLSILSTSDGRYFIRYEEAVKHTNGELDENTKPLNDKTITEWFPEDETN